jgi:hypothetical protein
MNNDIQCRKWIFVINNPANYGINHNLISEKLKSLKSLSYYCISDEMGTCYHTHIFTYFKNPVRFSTLKNLFPQAYLEPAKGTALQNRQYIFKENCSDKAKEQTNLPETHEEFGEMPIEKQGKRSDLEQLYELIENGCSKKGIFDINASYIRHFDLIDKVHDFVSAEKFKSEHPDGIVDREVYYVFGDTGTGKTSGILKRHGIDNVYRVTNYKNPFDGYSGQDVLVFEEFNSSLPIEDMLKYLDRYIDELPCRYVRKLGQYSIVYIVSNLSLSEQYVCEQKLHRKTWEAFTRRIYEVQHYIKGSNVKISLPKDYL